MRLPSATSSPVAFLASLLVAGCGDVADVTATSSAYAPITVTPLTAAVAFPAAPDLSRYETGAALARVADDAGIPVASTPQGLVAVSGTNVTPMTVYAATPSEPIATGAVLTMSRRLDGSLLVSADNGIFHSYQRRLLASPLGEALGGASALAIVDDDTGGETVYALVGGALHRVQAELHDRITIAEAPAVATALAALPDVVLVAYGDVVYELRTHGWTYRRVPAEVGVVTTMLGSASTGQIALAGPAGLVMRDRDGAYRRYTALGGIVALATDRAGLLFAQGPAGILRLDPAGPTGIASRDPTPAVGLAIDADGHTWFAQGEALVRLSTGRVVSFAAEIAPILNQRCGSCHTDGSAAPQRDFANYDLAVAMSDAIFTRVSTGLMPPRPEPALTPAEYDLLVRWYAGDQAP